MLQNIEITNYLGQEAGWLFELNKLSKITKSHHLHSIGFFV